MVGAPGTIPKSLAAAIEAVGIPVVTESLRIAALLSTAAILRHVMNHELLSSRSGLEVC